MNKIFTESKVSNRLAIGTIAIVALSIIHHIYGGFEYDTSWRVYMSILFFIPMLFLTLFLQSLAIKKKTISIIALYSILVFIGWVVVLGFGEGGYNHVVKNILYFGGASKSLMNTMFPPEFGTTKLFEKPNNWFFEITGILTTFFGFYISYCLIKFIRNQRSISR